MEFLKRFFMTYKEFINYINISEDEFYRVVDKFRSPHLWMCDGNKWSLRHIICN